jgi:hypothetical protein
MGNASCSLTEKILIFSWRIAGVDPGIFPGSDSVKKIPSYIFFFISTARKGKKKKNLPNSQIPILCVWGMRDVEIRPMLGAQGLWAGRDLFRATSAVTRSLGFSGLIRRTTPFSRPLRHTKGMASCLGWDRGPVSKQVWHDKKDDLDPIPAQRSRVPSIGLIL